MKKLFFVFIIILNLFFFVVPLTLPKPEMANFISASATLSNSTFSSETTMTISLTSINEIPSNGNILITVASNGFDFKNVDSSAISVVGCTDSNWNSVETVTCGTGSTNHTVLINRQTDSCPAGSMITITIKNVINPAPLNISRSQGQADIFDINIKSRDSSNNTLDKIDVKVAPVEGVTVSALVEETLKFTVVGVAEDLGSYCGIVRDQSSPDTTSFSIPWGTISPTYSTTANNTAQQLIVSTNASSGYKVYIEENDQLGRDNNTCPGAVPSSGQYMYDSNICIRDTLCDLQECNHTSSTDWIDTATFVGFGYSLDNQSGTDAKFLYNESGRNFSAKTLADSESSESQFDSNAEIMTNAGPVENSSINVCYRIAIPENQPAGNYYNKIRYTAMPVF